MNTPFAIDIDWRSANNDRDEIRITGAALSIRVGEHVATQAFDDWSKSVSDSIHVSAYPLALWFAASWWRLRWEPGFQESAPPLDWRQSHNCAAAGHGFIWPRLQFESDGEGIDIACWPTNGGPAEPLRYLSRFRAHVTIRDYERAIDDFVSLVLSRLDSQGIRDTELHATWADVMAERGSPQETRLRRTEARLGFDPDAAPEALLHEILNLDSVAGEAAAAELTPACAGSNPEERVARLLEVARSGAGIPARFTHSSAILETMFSADFQLSPPWERGWRLARSARKDWKLGDGPVSPKRFSEILGVTAKNLTNGPAAGSDLAAGLAVRQGGNKRSLFLRRANRQGRMFEAARLLVDDFRAPDADIWLPATGTKSVRQKVQRAFAAEFLCPIEALDEFLAGDYSPERCEDAAEYFDVAPITIRSHLANNHLIAVEDIYR